MKKLLLMVCLVLSMAVNVTGCSLAGGLLLDFDKAEKEKLVLEIPNGFKVQGAEGGVYYYVKDFVASNIVRNTSENDGSLKRVTGKAFIKVLEPELEAEVGVDLTLTLIDEEKIELDGHDGFVYSYSYKYNGVNIVQKQYIFENGDSYEFVTFTDFSEGYAQAFEACAESMKFEPLE